MILEDLYDIIQSAGIEDTKLYFITRFIKPGVAKRARVSEKYLYKVVQMDCNNEMREDIYNSSTKQIEKTISKNFDLVEYDVLMDDSDHLFTYPIKNKLESFSDVVVNQLQGQVPKVKCIQDLINENFELWAYCVEFYDTETKKKVYTFRKILPNRVGTAEKSSWLRAFVDTTSMQLCPIKGETVNLDEQIDCAYYDEVFYVLKKSYFEQIVGLQEEYKEIAIKVADNLASSNFIEGGEKLKQLVESKPSIHKKLVRIEKLGNYKNITARDITKMKQVCKRYGEKLTVKEGKICVADEKDIDLLLKVMADYWKKGEIYGKSYGSFSGKEIHASEEA